MECAVGGACASLESWRMRVFTRPVERPFFPARVRGVVATHQGAEHPGALAPSRVPVPSCRVVTEPPWTLRFNLPGGNAVSVRFASQPDAGLGDLPLGHAPVGSASSQVVEGFDLATVTFLLARRRPRRPPPVHPEASVDLETSLRTGTSIIAQVWRAPGRLFFVPWVGDSAKRRDSMGCACKAS